MKRNEHDLQVSNTREDYKAGVSVGENGEVRHGKIRQTPSGYNCEGDGHHHGEEQSALDGEEKEEVSSDDCALDMYHEWISGA